MPISAQHTRFVYPDYVSPLPADDLIKFAQKKQEMYDEGRSLVQKQIDTYGQIRSQLVRDQDKEYFDKSMAGLVKAINQSAGLDFSNKSNVQAVLNIGRPLENDSNLINSIRSSQNYSKMMEDYRKLDPKLRAPSNDRAFFKDIKSWMDNPSIGSSLNYNQYKPYADGVVKKWGEIEKSLKPTIETVYEQSPDGRWITKQKVSGVDQERFMKAYYGALTPQEQEQLRMDAEYDLEIRGKENVFANWQQSQLSNLNAYDNQVKDFEGKVRLAESKLGKNDPKTLQLQAELTKAKMYRDATADKASKTLDVLGDNELISHLIDDKVFNAAEGYAYKQVESDLQENKYTLEAYKSSMNLSEYQAKAQIDIQKAAVLDSMGLSTSGDGSKKASTPAGFSSAKESDLSPDKFNTYQDFSDLTSLSPQENSKFLNGLLSLSSLKLSDDKKSVVGNFSVDKQGRKKSNSTVQDILDIANSENSLSVAATTQLSNILGENREIYLYKLKGLFSKLQENPEELIKYTVQQGDKTFIRKQRAKDFLKEDADVVLPFINQVGVSIDE